MKRLAVPVALIGILSAACAHSSPQVAAAPVVAPDSVSAAETARLRAVETSYQGLRDSLAVPKPVPPASSAEALATMEQKIFFENNRSDLTDSAETILNDKIAVFGANPAMRIVIVGFASQPGTNTHNMALGLKRAEAAKAYLVSHGIDPVRIEIASRGEGELAVQGRTEVANTANRRGQFRLLIADPYLVETPKP
jgi:peptidoglycan-associated lipoprotein